MTKWTNKHNLPPAFAEAVRFDDYSAGDADFSVTGLLNPPLITRLVGLNENKIVKDASEMIWLAMGKALHTLMERHSKHPALTEGRIFWDFEGTKISGQPDNIEGRTLADWKATSVWTVIYGRKAAGDGSRSRFGDYEAQLNLYRYGLAANGIFVDNLEAWLLLRDWNQNEQKRSAERNTWYPPAPVYVHHCPTWPLGQTETFLRNKIKIHTTPTPNPCTDEDRWQQPSTFALMKKGRKTAVKVEDSRTKLLQYAAIHKIEISDPVYSIDERVGKNSRCEGYCDASPFCQQWKDIQNASSEGIAGS